MVSGMNVFRYRFEINNFPLLRKTKQKQLSALLKTALHALLIKGSNNETFYHHEKTSLRAADHLCINAITFPHKLMRHDGRTMCPPSYAVHYNIEIAGLDAPEARALILIFL